MNLDPDPDSLEMLDTDSLIPDPQHWKICIGLLSKIEVKFTIQNKTEQKRQKEFAKTIKRKESVAWFEEPRRILLT
jgi:hypothetical protein